MTTHHHHPIAPELHVSRWFNTDDDPTLAKLKGKVIVIEAFQMLCPGCVSHGLPQAKEVYETFPKDKVTVLGLHTVFEHHAAMTPTSLEAFLYEYRITFPVGVDVAGEGSIPKTMATYQMRGTPTLILIDAKGHLRGHYFGQVSNLRLGAEIATLMAEQTNDLLLSNPETNETSACNENGCTF